MHAMQHATLLLVLTSKRMPFRPTRARHAFCAKCDAWEPAVLFAVADDLAQRAYRTARACWTWGRRRGGSLTIASRGFRVVSTDFAPPNKALGATRAAGGLSVVEFHTADAQDLSRWGDGTFDAASARTSHVHARRRGLPRGAACSSPARRSSPPVAAARPGGHVRRGS